MKNSKKFVFLFCFIFLFCTRAESYVIYSEFIKTAPSITWNSIDSMYNPGVFFNFYRENTSFNYGVYLTPVQYNYNFAYNNIYYDNPERFVLKCEFTGWGDSNADYSIPLDLNGYVISSIQLENAAIDFQYSEMFNAIFIVGYGNLNIYGELKINQTPEPTALLLFGTGLVGLAAVGRKKRS